MPKQKIINRTTCNRMRGKLNDVEQLCIYSSADNYSVIEEDNLLNTTIELPEEAPKLEVSGRITANDADNAVKVYNYLGHLTRTQAADTRLWTTLTHTTFWDYCRERWYKEKNINYVTDHWFERRGGGLGALRRNAISRLWWAAHLTLAPWEFDDSLNMFKSSDRAKYTRTLLSQSQIFQDVLERSYGSNLHVRICLLDALTRYLPEVSNKDDLSKDVSKKLNLLLKHRQIDAMQVPELHSLVTEYVKNSAERLSGEHRVVT